MNQITSQEVLEDWKNTFPSLGIEIVFQKCLKCGNENYCQHQGYCIECMAKNANIGNQIKEELKNKCAMCGKKHIATPSKTIKGLMDNVCNRCLKNSF